MKEHFMSQDAPLSDEVDIAVLDVMVSPPLQRSLSRVHDLVIRLERLDAGAYQLFADLALRCVQRHKVAALDRVTSKRGLPDRRGRRSSIFGHAC